MSTVVVEYFEVCHGTDINDGSPLVIATGLTIRSAATTLRNAMDAAKTAGQLDATTYPANKVFYVRSQSGEQTVTVAASTPATIIAELDAANISLAAYMKIDGAYQIWASLPLSLIRAQQQ